MRDRCSDAKRLFTEKCLIVADIDKTLLDQFERRSTEKLSFLRDIAQELHTAANYGANISVITGNSMDQLTSRFFKWLIKQLTHIGDVASISKFHFFCNSGGIYAHIPADDSTLIQIAERLNNDDIEFREIFDNLTIKDSEGKLAIHPRFIDEQYVSSTSIDINVADKISKIVKEVSTSFQETLFCEIDSYKEEYDIIDTKNETQKHDLALKKIYPYILYDNDGNKKYPYIENRLVKCGRNSPFSDKIVQITVKPILSFRHAKNPDQMIGNDFRKSLMDGIQEKLDQNGYTNYIARSGGRTSIDITLEKLDKAYAIEFLINRLNVQGSSRNNLKFGSNTIYLGDEVIVGGGNDYPVTRIPGLLVFAVNSDRNLIPLRSDVIVPSNICSGPQASKQILQLFNTKANEAIIKYCKSESQQCVIVKYKSAVECLKSEIFIRRIRDKINTSAFLKTLPNEDLKVLHTFVTLMNRKDPIARKWLSILADEFDAIMINLESSITSFQDDQRELLINAIGSSYNEEESPN